MVNCYITMKFILNYASYIIRVLYKELYKFACCACECVYAHNSGTSLHNKRADVYKTVCRQKQYAYVLVIYSTRMLRPSSALSLALIGLLLALVSSASGAMAAPPHQRQDPEPAFCHDLDCPKYTVVNKTDKYEERKYEASKWVGTLVQDIDWQKAVNIGFELLFAYISGANSAKEKIPMTAPVATQISPGQGPACVSNFTVLFFIPFAFKDNTPKPTNPNVTLVDLPEVTVYVISYGGYADDNTLAEEGTALYDDLKADGKKNFVTDPYFCAGYDPPYRIVGRHNEIWYLAQ